MTWSLWYPVDAVHRFAEIVNERLIEPLGATFVRRFRDVPAELKRKYSYVFLLVVIVITGGLGYCADKFTSTTQAAVRVPIGSPMDITETFLDFNTYGMIMVNPVFVRLELMPNDGGTHSNVNFITGCHALQLIEYIGFTTLKFSKYHLVDKVQSYYTPDQNPPFASADQFMKNNFTTTLILYNVRAGRPVPIVVDLLRTKLRMRINETTCPGARVDVTVTSIVSMAEDMKSSVVADLERVDLVSIPLALISLMVCIRSVRLLLVPLAAIPVAVCLSLGFNYPVAKRMIYSTVTPEVVSATVVALSIDFGLFFLSRFIECREHFMPIRNMRHLLEGVDSATSPPAVDDSADFAVLAGGKMYPRGESGAPRSCSAISHSTAESSDLPDGEESTKRRVVDGDSATVMSPVQFRVAQMSEWQFRQFLITNAVLGCYKNIAFSSFTIALVFSCLCSSSIQEIQTVGIGSVLAATCCAVVALGVAPVILFLAYDALVGDFMVDFQARMRLRWTNVKSVAIGLLKRNDASRSEVHPAINRSVSDDERAPLMSVAAASSSPLTAQRASPYYKIAVIATSYPYLVLLCAAVFIAPFAYATWHVRLNFDLMTEVPLHAPDVDKYISITREFGPNMSNPFYLVFRWGERWTDTVPISDEMIKSVTRAARQLSAPIIRRVATPFFFDGRVLNAAEATFRLRDPDDPFGAHFWSMCQGDGVSFGAVSSCVVAAQVFGDPFGSVGLHALRLLDDITRASREPPSADSSLLGYYGPNADSFTLLNIVYSEFPYQLAMIGSVMFCAVFVVFRSIMLAVRLVVTVLFTVTVSFGTASFVYCVPAHLYPESSRLHDVHAIQWIIPIIALSFMISLAIDYDSYLVVRLLELRRLGFTDRAATIKAVYRTGRVISFAGVIMALALGSLMVSDAVMLQQFGLLMFVNVLVDSFLVRPLLVPALLSIAPSLLWFPRRDLPRPFREVDDMLEGHEEVFI